MVATPPTVLTDHAPFPRVPVALLGSLDVCVAQSDVGLYILDLAAALKACHDDKDALREWFEKEKAAH